LLQTVFAKFPQRSTIKADWLYTIRNKVAAVAAPMVKLNVLRRDGELNHTRIFAPAAAHIEMHGNPITANATTMATPDSK